MAGAKVHGLRADSALIKVHVAEMSQAVTRRNGLPLASQRSEQQTAATPQRAEQLTMKLRETA
jgi:hypothetical protein